MTTGKVYKRIMLALAFVFFAYAAGLFIYYIICCILHIPHVSSEGNFSYRGVMVFTGYLMPAVIALFSYFKARRGKKANWMMIAMFIGSIIFTGLMTGDMLNYYFRGTSPHGDASRYLGSYHFNIYYIPIVYTPLFTWIMAAVRGRLSFKPNYLERDTQSDRSAKKVEAVFYVINYAVALVLLVGALYNLVTSNGWGALLSMLWSWMCFIPLVAAFFIWLGIFAINKPPKRVENEKQMVYNTDEEIND